MIERHGELRIRIMIRALIISFFVLPGTALSDLKDGKLEIQKIADSVYLHTSFKRLRDYGYYPSNGLVVLDNTDAYIIDTPWPEKDIQTLVEWIEHSGFTLIASISTHFHEDRTSGIGYLNKHSVKTYASELTNQQLASIGDEKATYEFEGTEFSLLEGVIEAYYPGAGHTMDNIVVWLPNSRTLFGGCLIRSLAAKNMGNTADATMGDWALTVKRVLEKFSTIEQVVPGHGKLGDAELLRHTIKLAKEANAYKSIQKEVSQE